ncbi:hypothetical protein CICLE_v10018106mg [Citrus x clementina]|uniref:Uncharacterized protein n=1 Tax=Citrus clementina TaxID=85681 RepID=V4TFJ6_CITCL|nr:UPF0481 protein At3g47200 [Citrus x clementina]ESR59123.1 hypothetical protein CICLE_v10018106mg [Citrus x clementina]
MDDRAHEDENEHVPIDMKKLADSLSGKLETLPPLSGKCSIYRMPEPRRCLNPSQYTPQMVSIGPFHHGKEELKAMEEHKQRYLKCFLQRTKVCMARFLAFIKEREAELLSCYAETIHNLQSDDFVKMVLVDAVFLIEFFLRVYKPDCRTDDDRIFTKTKLFLVIRSDFLLLENQLPLFILNDLLNLAKTATYDDDFFREISLLTITISWFWQDISVFIPIEKELFEIHFSEAAHFLDLLILCLQPSLSGAPIQLKYLNVPGAKELHQAGVKFKVGSSQNLLDIKFEKGIFEIPFIPVFAKTQLLCRNLLAFEWLHDYTPYFNDYIIIIAILITAPKDAELLFENEIVGLSEELPTIFGNLSKDCTWVFDEFLYSGLLADLYIYRKSPWHKWKATLKQNYFNTWATISVMAAVILLLLTATQTVSSLIAL